MKNVSTKALCIIVLCGLFGSILYSCGKKEEAIKSGPPADVQQFFATLESMPETQRPPYLRAYPEMTQKVMSSSDPQVQARLRKLVPGAFSANR
jgi:hypothetical protein